MATRSIASLTLSFGLVSIPIKLYSATESSTAIRFKLMASGGGRLRQQYVADPPVSALAPEASPPPASVSLQAARRAESQSAPDDVAAPVPTPYPAAADSRVLQFPGGRIAEEPTADEPALDEPASDEPVVIERSEIVKGYEFERGKFVLFTADELKALEAGARKTIDIVTFVPQAGVDPIYYDKAYFLAPDKRGGKPYSLLLRAMRESGRCAIGKWAFRSKEYAVQIRPVEGGMVLQQLLYAEEVRPISALDIDLVEVGDAELNLAKQLIERVSADTYDPSQFVDEEKQRILAAVEEKIAGKEIVAPEESRPAATAQVVDLMEALRASLRQVEPAADPVKTPSHASSGERKPVKRASVRTPDVVKPTKRQAKR